MTEDKKLNFVKIEATGFQDLCNRLAELEQENKELKLENDFLSRENDNNRKEKLAYKNEATFYRNECNTIKQMSMYEFANKYCTSKDLEEAGHELARALGVGQ